MATSVHVAPGHEAARLQALVDELLAREEELEPQLGALLPEARRPARLRAEAAALAEKAQASASQGLPLLGLVAGAKDVFLVAGLPTRAGALGPFSLEGHAEAEAVRRLREGGALVLGKLATTEFAYFPPAGTRNPVAPGCTPGGSSAGGDDDVAATDRLVTVCHFLKLASTELTYFPPTRTRNPMASGCTPEGSSTGSAAAVAAGLCDIALASQICASISRPAAYCHVVGFKPTHGRVPQQGLLSCAPALDQVGWMARSISVTALAASVLLEDWDSRAAARAGAGRDDPATTGALADAGAQGSVPQASLRIGVPPMPAPQPPGSPSRVCPLLAKCHPSVLSAFKHTIASLTVSTVGSGGSSRPSLKLQQLESSPFDITTSSNARNPLPELAAGGEKAFESDTVRTNMRASSMEDLTSANLDDVIQLHVDCMAVGYHRSFSVGPLSSAREHVSPALRELLERGSNLAREPPRGASLAGEHPRGASLAGEPPRGASLAGESSRGASLAGQPARGSLTKDQGEHEDEAPETTPTRIVPWDSSDNAWPAGGILTSVDDTLHEHPGACRCLSRMSPVEIRCKRSQVLLRESLDKFMALNGVDALLYPATAALAPALEQNSTGDPTLSIPWSHAGAPTVTLPCSLPSTFGVTVVGRFGEDELSLGICQILEPLLKAQSYD